jgi:hypothetical protein
MPANFEWQTEEEDETVWRQEVASRSSRQRYLRWRSALLVLTALIAVAFFAYRGLRESVAQAEAQTAEELVASYRVAQRAAVNRDSELLASVLSGSDRTWTETQYDLLAAGLLFERAAASLGLPTGDVSSAVTDVTFSPDLRSAEIVASHTYSTARDVPLVLQQTLVYRRGDGRWLLSPPRPEFWGDWGTVEGNRLTLTYPGRDGAIAERLGRDLEAVLRQMCAVPAQVTCGPDFRLNVRFEKDPQTVLGIADPRSRLLVAREVDLPTPTLIGVPTDERGYQLLLRGYASRVIRVTLDELVVDKCCTQGRDGQIVSAWDVMGIGRLRTGIGRLLPADVAG